jgi:anti-anti-sigma regulatory factor
MIHIKQEVCDDFSVTIHVDGMLDRESMPLFRAVCESHLENKRRVSIDLRGLFHICREGIHYLTHVHPRVAFVNTPEFVKTSFNNHGHGGSRGRS